MMMMGKIKNETVLAQIRHVVETQEIDLATLCSLLGIDQFDILGRFEENALDAASLFGVDPNMVADLIEGHSADSGFREFDIFDED